MYLIVPCKIINSENENKTLVLNRNVHERIRKKGMNFPFFIDLDISHSITMPIIFYQIDNFFLPYSRLVISSLIPFCYALWMLRRTSCYDWGDQNTPLGKDGGLKFVSESLFQNLTHAEEYANSTSEGYIYHTELYFNTND